MLLTNTPRTTYRTRFAPGDRRPVCTADCTGRRCAGIHPEPLPASAPDRPRGVAALMRTTEARVQTR